MIRNHKNALVIKPVENRLKIDSYKPTMHLTMISNPRKNIRSRTIDQRSSLTKNTKSEESKNNVNKHGAKLQPILTKKSVKIQLQNANNKQNLIESKKSVISFQSKGSIRSKSKKNIPLVNPLQQIQEPEMNTIITFDQNLSDDMNHLKNYFEEIISFMEKKYMLSINAGYVKIKKDKMLSLMLYIVKNLLEVQPKGCGDSSSHKQYPQHDMIPIFEKITTLSSAILLQKKSNKLRDHKRVVQIQVSSCGYLEQEQITKNKLSQLLEKQQILNEKIKRLNEEVTLRSEKWQLMNNEMIKAQKTVEELKKQTQFLQDKKNQLEKKIQEFQKQFDSVQQKGNEVFLFVEKQKQRPFLNKVSLDYKHMQSVMFEMFDYAFELSCRAQMHSYTWEPHPFKEMEKHIKADMEHTVWIIENQKFPLEKKISDMKEFLLKTMRKLNSKDRELEKVVKNKTDAINQFINHMRQWYQEHCMKNQYLETMRKEYAVDAEAVEQCIHNFENSELNEEQKKWIAKLRKYWDWVHLAFLYGNSFY